jgi:hypothetical protein
MLGISKFTSNSGQSMLLGVLANIANPGGGSAGASVSVPVSLVANGVGLLPPVHAVVVTTSQACFTNVISKSTTGLTVVLTPTGAGVTLAAGTFDLIIFG